MLHRVGAVDTWERKRLDQAAEDIRADAAKKRENYFSGLQAAVDQMRDRGQTLAKIAALVEVDVREIQTALRRARTGDNGSRGSTCNSSAVSRSTRPAAPGREHEQQRPTVRKCRAMFPQW